MCIHDGAVSPGAVSHACSHDGLCPPWIQHDGGVAEADCACAKLAEHEKGRASNMHSWTSGLMPGLLTGRSCKTSKRPFDLSAMEEKWHAILCVIYDGLSRSLLD